MLVALLLFGLFSLATLVIDVGFARLTQRQLQVAADAAALEGLRGEGEVPLADRQAAAQLVIAQTFDDDLDPDNGDDGIAGTGGQFGAGPQVEFSGGVGDPSLVAGQLLTVDPNNPVFLPQPLSQPGTAGVNGEFSVILQRGGNVDQAVQNSANLLEIGPAVPFLFGRGSLVSRSEAARGPDVDDGLDIADGLAVGGVATAVGVPALAVGSPVVDPGDDLVSSLDDTVVFPGAVAIGFRLSDWNGTVLDPNSDPNSPAFLPPRTDPREVGAAKTTIGQTVVEGAPATLVDGYCCIYADVAGVDRVIGFGRIADGVALPEVVAVANATGRLSDVWSAIDTGVRGAVLAANGTIDGGLLVASPQ